MNEHQELETYPSWRPRTEPLRLSRLAQGTKVTSLSSRTPNRVLLGIGDVELRTEMYSLMTSSGLAVNSSEDGDHLLRRIGDAILQLDGCRRPELIIADSMLTRCHGEELRHAIQDLHWETSLILLHNGFATAYRRAASPLSLGEVDAQYLCDFSQGLLDSLECIAYRESGVSQSRWFSISDALRTISLFSKRATDDAQARIQ